MFHYGVGMGAIVALASAGVGVYYFMTHQKELPKAKARAKKIVRKVARTVQKANHANGHARAAS